MKRSVLWAAVLMGAIVFGLLSPSSICASDLKGKFALSGQGGMVIPVGDFADEEKFDAGTGFGFGGAGEYFVSNNVAVGATFRYTTNGVKEMPGSVDADWKLTNFGAFVKYIFPTRSNVVPYMRVGLGLYKTKFSASSGAAEASLSFDSKFGFAGGGGVMFHASDNVLLGGEILFHNAMTDGAKADVDSGELELDANVQCITIYGGITFLIGGTR